MQVVSPNTLEMSIPVGNQNQVGDNHTKGLTLGYQRSDLRVSKVRPLVVKGSTLACKGYICKYFYILTNS